jgi:hypothetical protein
MKFRLWVGVVVVGILVAGSGFVFKLTEFIKVARNHDAESFALVPVVMYFLVTGGFICVFIWNYLRGGLENVEAPKYELLKRHEEIDRHDAAWSDGRRGTK